MGNYRAVNQQNWFSTFLTFSDSKDKTREIMISNPFLNSRSVQIKNLETRKRFYLVVRRRERRDWVYFWQYLKARKLPEPEEENYHRRQLRKKLYHSLFPPLLTCTRQRYPNQTYVIDDGALYSFFLPPIVLWISFQNSQKK